MQPYLGEFGCGNQDISGGLTQFWLGSSLEISAEEQIDFLDRLRLSNLPVSSRSMDIVKEVILLDERDGYVCRGKMGSCVPEGEQPLGWFVGYVERDDATHIFATNIQAVEANGVVARRISEDILEHLAVLR